MTIQELMAGESKSVEFKEALPEKSIKYMKTVAAFANGKGGKLIFGVQDETCKVIGMDNETVFKTMDAITNAIMDSCEPVIIPDVTLQTIENKTIIVVEIFPGRQKPYYIKAQGIVEGTYIRVSGTTRHVEHYMLQELLLEGSNRSYDQLALTDKQVSDEAVQQLCDGMKEYALSRCCAESEKNSIRDLTKNQLLSWGVLEEKEGVIVPANAFFLLSGGGHDYPQAIIQCAVFKGSTRSVFVDRKEYDGPLYQQIEEAYQFVLRNIRMGAKIEGMFRQDIYEFPVGTIRELISNAVCHRSYLDPGNVQIALYDDRLEVTSPGMLLGDVTLEKMKDGYSKIRNRAIANVFAYMKIIERWGSGIPRIFEECREYGLREPELIDMEGDFRINLYRKESISVGKGYQENADKVRINIDEIRTNADNQRINTDNQRINTDNQRISTDNIWKDADIVRESADKIWTYPSELTNAQKKIMHLVRENGRVSNKDVQELLGIKDRRALVVLTELTTLGVLKKKGQLRGTYYTLSEK